MTRLDDGDVISIDDKAKRIFFGQASSVMIQNTGEGAVRLGSYKVSSKTGIRLPHRAVLVLSDKDIPDEVYAVAENGVPSNVLVVALRGN